MAPRIPNLFLVGAMRAGTTALHHALDAHPQISMSTYKEPAFFADPAELAADSRTVSDAGYAANPSRYLELFAASGDAAYVGESSTHYTKLPRVGGVAARIADFSPDARIVYLVRDPVERTLSHYRYAVRKKSERRACLDAVHAGSIYCSVSHYAMQLEPYLEHFGHDRIHVCVLERLRDDAATELGGLYRWLGLDVPELDHGFERRNSVGADVLVSQGPTVLHAIGRSAGYQRLARRVLPDAVRTGARRLLYRPLSDEEVRDPLVLDHLRFVHEPQVVELERMLGRTFPDWATLRPE